MAQKEKAQKQKGFTLIELILFLALSALFLLIAFMGLRGETDQVHRTDSMRSLEAYLEAEIQSIRGGVNTNSSSLAPDGDQIILGRMYQPMEGTSEIKSYIIVADRPTDINDPNPPHVGIIIRDLNPQVVGNVVAGNYELTWGLELYKTLSKGATGYKSVAFFGFLTNPYNNELNIIIMEGECKDTAGASFNTVSNAIAYLNDDANYEFHDPGSDACGLNRAATLYNQRLSLHLCYADSSGNRAELVGGERKLGMVLDVKFDNNITEYCS